MKRFVYTAVMLLGLAVQCGSAVADSPSPLPVQCSFDTGTEAGANLADETSEITFTRSGGLVAINVSGKIVFRDGRAQVQSLGGGYCRELSPEERDLLARPGLLEVQRKLLSLGLHHREPGVPDAFQYDVSTTLADGTEVQIGFWHPESSELLRADPRLPGIVNWVVREIDSIWKAKTAGAAGRTP